MYFESVEQILRMDGHGAFVWSAYLITVVVLAGVLIAPGRRRKQFLRQLAGELKRSQGAPGSTKEEA
jgi:heme exporter protein D